MSDWIDDFKESEKQKASAQAMQAELTLIEARKYQALVPDWWDTLAAQIERDAERLELSISIKRTPYFKIERSTPRQIICIAVQPKLDAQQIRIAYSHSDNGITFQSDDVEIFKLKVGDNETIEAHGHGQTFRTIADISQYLLLPLINPKSHTTSRQVGAWS